MLLKLNRRPRARESASFSFSLPQHGRRRRGRRGAPRTCIDHDAVSGSRVPRPSAAGPPTYLLSSATTATAAAVVTAAVRHIRASALALFYPRRSLTLRESTERRSSMFTIGRHTVASPRERVAELAVSESHYHSSLGVCNPAQRRGRSASSF